ncbi:DUF1127 domain-containing protein [Actibacterium lipolyticum]|uniref:YjiS-like domain-containing protein n=1 Tax=Actibacterium lipolyticum TaxID=1524263 RepID=A0A238KVP1_9RHOB|nr:DUF1127 domain-containing protein [Actibacterium lipolyticum]SMX46700.1 hypothetical protein COL8621_03218 [Actibacterium lipolyticum]
MALASDIRNVETGLAHAVRNVIDTVRVARARRAAFNTTFRELSALTDRDLADLGIHRGEITRIAREEAALV